MGAVFHLLGPVALGPGAAVAVAVPKVRCLLAVLLLDANRQVSLDRLTDELWADDPPRSAVANLRSYASTLRRLLAAAGVDPDRLETTAGGYRLRVEDGESDLAAWEADADRGRAALTAGRPADAVPLLERALARWRGPALADVPVSAALAARATALGELRTAASEDLFEARLLAGDGTALVAPLRGHLAAHPTRERGYGQLMRVLYGSGDPAAALEVYRQAHAALQDELGLSPGPELRETQAAILRRDPALAARTAAAAPPADVPRQLPADIPVLVGRDRELDRLVRSGAAVHNIHGAGGVGKSALAVRAAHRLADRYPDGQLYLDLQGSNPRLTPLTGDEVTSRFLRALGVAEAAVPATPAEATTLYRSQLAQRRMLILLDNAVDAAQVRPLLPGTASSLVVVTSRRALTSLDGAELLPLDVLSEDDAAELVDRLAGPGRGPAATKDLVALCGKLPLALRIAAARLAARPDWTADDLVERLVDERMRLDELHTDDMAVRSCFHASYRALEPVAARAFRMSGLARVPHLTVPSLAALLGESKATAAAALDRLVEARLVEADGGRYRLHDLLRLYAAERSTAEDGAEPRAAAVHRALVYYLGTARRAVYRLHTVERPADPAFDGPEGTGLVRIDTVDDAHRWLELDWPCALAIAAQAGELTGPSRGYPARLLRGTSHHLMQSRQWRMVGQIATVALETCAPDDLQSQAVAHGIVGQQLTRYRRTADARRHLEQAAQLWQRLGEPDGQAVVLNSLGFTARLEGDLPGATEYFQACLTVLRRLGHRSLEANVLNNLADTYAEMGRIDAAVSTLHLAVEIRAGGIDLIGRIGDAASLARFEAMAGRWPSALRQHARAVRLARAVSDRTTLALQLLMRAETCVRLGRPDLALAEAALIERRYGQLSNRYIPAAAERLRVKALRALGDPGADAALDRARDKFRLVEPQDAAIEYFLFGDDPTLPHPP
ncbi:SARP family transcriptional regulator [Catellatospora sp. TT07R-123]|uniref:AfsR/SARP family transcriptional regulator n=1 Tax=Catellatospora sp. TT07R-123 TaxID=2733863 RepID=UPI001B1DA07D|nr:BTAD domain-containing putative transcriptional regulator [Catellatospora sp. TT07R-123]GHJ49134.1 SARP family transcriptional regulator [Catellatospora sp. TT07R-123]